MSDSGENHVVVGGGSWDIAWVPGHWTHACVCTQRDDDELHPKLGIWEGGKGVRTLVAPTDGDDEGHSRDVFRLTRIYRDGLTIYYTQREAKFNPDDWRSKMGPLRRYKMSLKPGGKPRLLARLRKLSESQRRVGRSVK